MSLQSSSSGQGSQSEEITIRIPRDKRKKFTLMKFGTSNNLDFSRLGDQPVRIERENNLKEYKTANDLDLLPKFGAGSEYGREQKEESRRKKYGILLKKYNPHDQPWQLKIGSGKQAKRYKGVREGTINMNTSYYVFTKAADGAFEAFPVEEWYNFNPVIKYRYLNSEEAEEEFSRRDKTLNHFTIMLKKKLRKDDNVDDDDDDEGGGKGNKKSKKKKSLILTDMEDWEDFKMSDDDDDDDEDGEKQDEESGKSKKKKVKGKKKATKNSKKNSDDEAIEESDEGDFDDREVDYMSDSGSSSSFSGGEQEGKKEEKVTEKGVDEEAGLRNILDSDAEDEAEEEEDKEEIEEEIEEKDDKKGEKKKGDDSSSSSSDDDSDLEKDIQKSALFLQKKERKEKKDSPTKEATTSSSQQSAVTETSKEKVTEVKRKLESPQTQEGKQPTKRLKTEDISDGITEDAIRRYLMRKPMTTKDLLSKFKSKKLNMTNEQITHAIAQLLKKINPEQKTINKKLYLSLKKPE